MSVFPHLPSYGCIREKQTRKTDKKKKKNYLSFLSVFLICLATATLEKNRQQKRKPIYLSRLFSSVWLRLHWRKNTQEREREKKKKKTPIYLYRLFFLSALLRLHCRKTDKKNTSIYLYCLFFSSALLRLHWRKIDLKKKPIYLSCLFFSSALLRLHRRKIDKKNTPIYLSCRFFSHLPCYGYIVEKQTRKMHLFIFLVCFFSSAFLRLHWREIDKKK